MDLKVLEGIFPPVFTPLHHDGSLNISVIPSYAEYLQQHGAHGVYVTGTAGEGMSLTVPERKLVAKAWIEAGKRCSLKTIIQIGAGCLKDTQDLATYMEQEGSTAIASLPNLYDKPESVEDLVEYLKEISLHAPNTPLLYYHIPFKTGVTVAMDKVMEEGSKKIPSLAGMKYTDQDIAGEGARCLTAGGGRLRIFSGFDQLFAEGQRHGYCGAVSVSFNLMLSEALVIYNNKGHGSEAEAAQIKITETLDLIYKQTGGFSVSAIKAAMRLLTGINVGPARKPLKNLTQNQINVLQQDLVKAGFNIHK